MKRLCVLLVLMLSLLPIPTRAATITDAVNVTANRLKAAGIITGDPGGDFHILSPITRAEMTKIVVLALGGAAAVQSWSGPLPFADMEGHWALPYVAIAVSAKLVSGYPDGTFRPDAPVSYGEAVTLIDRTVGLAPVGDAWPDNYMTAAIHAGIVSPGDVSQPSRVAVRGVVFILADKAFSSVRMPGGKTVYETVLAQSAVGASNQSQPAPTTPVSPLPVNSPPPTVSPPAIGGSYIRTHGEILTASNDDRFLIDTDDGTHIFVEAKTYCFLYDEGDNVVVVYNIVDGFMVKSGGDKCEFWTEDVR